MSTLVQDQTKALTQLLARVKLLAGNQKSTTDSIEATNIVTRAEGAGIESSLSEQLPRDLESVEDKRRLRAAEEIIESLWFPTVMEREEAI